MLHDQEDLRIDNQIIRSNEDLVRMYQNRIREFGFVSKTLLYASEERHAIKVTQYITLLHKLVMPGDAVLDIGCGYGSLVPFLPPCRYRGIDIVPEFIARARERYESLDFEAVHLDQCEGQYDWCVMLGVANSVPEPERLIDLAWDKCRKGLVIDFVDRKKIAVKEVNDFSMGACLEKFLSLGAAKVEVHPTSYTWTIFVVKKQGEWLSVFDNEGRQHLPKNDH